MERLNPLNDYLFGKFMGETGDEPQLLSFLSAVLERTGKGNLASVEILENTKLTAEVIGDKTSILDIRAKMNDGTRANIEVQLRNYGNMDRRSLFYASREYIMDFKKGQDYSELPNVIAINIINFEYMGLPEFHTSFHLREDRHPEHILTDALEIHFVDMIKFKRLKKKDIQGDPLQRWLAFLDEDAPPEIVEEVLKMDPAIQQAQEKLTYVSSDKEALRYYHMREMAESDYASGMNQAKREGATEERDKWQAVVADKDAALANKETALADKDAEIERLRARLEKNN
jgi:predicted transposase/invertase (TIGR01784 family)